MPQLQMVDTSQPREKSPLEVTLENFTKKHQENERAAKESKALKNLYNQYKQDQSFDDYIANIQSDTEIGPSAKVQAVNQAQYQKTQQDRYALEQLKLAKKIDKTIQQNTENERQKLISLGMDEDQVDVYLNSTPGVKAQIYKDFLDQKSRESSPQNLQPEKEGELIDYDKGLTRDQRIQRQNQRTKSQEPLVKKLGETIRAREADARSIKQLQTLNDTGKVGTGSSRLNINPKTGDLLIPAAATPEEQLFAKTVNDFTTRAKESYGGRVTNFELDRFMQRLPTLANSVEGRSLILRQMDLVNQMMLLEDTAIRDEFDLYGVGKIDWSEADKNARNRTKEEKKDLERQLLDFNKAADIIEKDIIEQERKKLKSGNLLFQKPDGSFTQGPKSSLEAAKRKGYKLL